MRPLSARTVEVPVRAATSPSATTTARGRAAAAGVLGARRPDHAAGQAARERDPGLLAMQGAERLEERLLAGLLGQGRVSEDGQGRAKRHGPVAAVQLLVALLVPVEAANDRVVGLGHAHAWELIAGRPGACSSLSFMGVEHALPATRFPRSRPPTGRRL